MTRYIGIDGGIQSPGLAVAMNGKLFLTTPGMQGLKPKRKAAGEDTDAYLCRRLVHMATHPDLTLFDPEAAGVPALARIAFEYPMAPGKHTVRSTATLGLTTGLLLGRLWPEDREVTVKCAFPATWQKVWKKDRVTKWLRSKQPSFDQDITDDMVSATGVLLYCYPEVEEIVDIVHCIV